LSFAPHDLSLIGFNKKETAYVPKPLHALLNNEKWDEENDIIDLDLPILKVNSDGSLVELYDQNVLHALGLAAYLGRADAVQHLLKRGVDVCRQQTISGHTALHLVLMGAKADESKHERAARFKIIEMLLAKQTTLQNITFEEAKNNVSPLV